jgi:hypothetical protein
MYYFLHGDIPKAVNKAKQMVDAMIKKQPDASYFKLNSDNFSVSELQELIGSQGLFSKKYIVNLRNLLEDKEIKEEVLDLLEEMRESQNIFIWVESQVNKVDLKKIEKHAEKVQVFSVSIPTTSERIAKEYSGQNHNFNIFSLGESLGARNKKKLWIDYVEALNYFPPEEIHGTLFWQLKNIILASKVKSVKETDLKPFVFNKAKTFSKNYSKEELEKLSSELVSISHDARRGKHSFEIALERFVLSI